MRNPGKHFLLLTTCLASGLMLCGPATRAAADEARVTRVVHDVKLLSPQTKPKPAALNDKVGDGTGVRTGDSSRSELTFVDLTIERLGSNSVFSFNQGGRSVSLSGGSVLLRVPKDSGGATMTTNAVTVGITGTTVILETTRAGRNRLIALEGGAKVSLNKNRSQSVYVRGGQMEDVPPGATTLPPPVNVNLSDIMRTHPLITGFGPLPSRDLIMATASNPPPVSQGQPPDGEPPPPLPGIVPPIIPTIVGVGLPIIGGGGSSHPTHGNTNTHGNTDTHGNRNSDGNTRTNGNKDKGTKYPGKTNANTPKPDGNSGRIPTTGGTNTQTHPATGSNYRSGHPATITRRKKPPNTY
ncbi:MAG TPA: FecR family protein [Chthoniobacterales bacterium]